MERESQGTPESTRSSETTSQSQIAGSSFEQVSTPSTGSEGHSSGSEIEIEFESDQEPDQQALFGLQTGQYGSSDSDSLGTIRRNYSGTQEESQSQEREQDQAQTQAAVQPSQTTNIGSQNPNISPSTAGNTRMSSAPQPTVTINGKTLTLNATPVQSTAPGILHPASDRKNLSRDKLNDLFEKATYRAHDKFKSLNYRLDDPDKLEDTSNLQSQIEAMQTHHKNYDLHDVFKIVKYDDANMHKIETDQVDLYENYASVTEEEVARSNKWYNTMIDGDEGLYIRQNLNLTAEYLHKACEPSLERKVKETYNTYSPEEQGGPLFFKILMDTLQNNSEEASLYLINMVKQLNISKLDGKNVATANTLIRSALSRLTNLKDENGKSRMPDDMYKSLIKVYQTSSVAEFNETFALLEKQQRISMNLKKVKQGLTTELTIDELVQLAENTYNQLCQTNQWSGVKNKQNETSFVARFTNALAALRPRPI